MHLSQHAPSEPAGVETLPATGETRMELVPGLGPQPGLAWLLGRWETLREQTSRCKILSLIFKLKTIFLK